MFEFFCRDTKTLAAFRAFQTHAQLPVSYYRSLTREACLFFHLNIKITLHSVYRAINLKRSMSIKRESEAERGDARAKHVVLSKDWRLTNLTFRRGPLRGRQHRARLRAPPPPPLPPSRYRSLGLAPPCHRGFLFLITAAFRPPLFSYSLEGIPFNSLLVARDRRFPFNSLLTLSSLSLL